MNIKILGLLAVGLTAGPIAANAQTTTLDYQGSVMYGISTYLPFGQTQAMPLPSANFTGAFTASIILTGSLSANNLSLVSYDISLNGTNGTNFSLANISAFPPIIGVTTNFCGVASCIDITTSNGAITGAIIDLSSTPYHGSQVQVAIGPTGDSFSYLFATANGTCENYLPGDGSPYTGSAINPCTVSTKNIKAGVWTATQAPEIDSASAAGGLALLVGGVAVLRGRRAKQRAAA
jgi:hypothetical protein